jgi:hypothetical protein
MTDWRKARDFCNSCGRWDTDFEHENCPYGSRGSLVWIDIDNFRKACSKCNQTWALENTIMYCSRGHMQRTEYVDSVVTVEAGEQVIATDGNLVYVLTRTGTVVVSRRSFPGTGY